MALQMQQTSAAFTISSPSTAAARIKLSPFRTVAVNRGVRCSGGGVGVGGGDAGKKKAVPNSNYVVPIDKFSSSSYHANRMLSFYAPGWCGEVRDVIFSENGNVTVVYRLTIRGSDGEAHRESTGTVTTTDDHIEDPVTAAEEIAFCRACARFGLGLYLYHE
ncbi:unnamed protein product [Arabidopsis thaliana]|uniref:(thale cress) hypothetical protein n=1 Tax=Arabidopsis thaliana TaxID=3702 RepID=A0A7G2FEE0_ARATH|nr:unnamed protein product [Arabidopsis thaliana]